MELENIAQILIYMHAGLGGIALMAGGVALFVSKGNKIHKTSGKMFFYTMLASAILAFIVSVLPNHENPFLFSIGLFSIYFIISGYRSLRFKNVHVTLQVDKIIAYCIILTGIVMVLYPIVFNGRFNIVLSVFGMVGLVFGLRDVLLMRDIQQLKKNWLKLHLGKMSGGYIAAVSAFFVVNQILPGIWNWFVPGIVGSVYITYWMMKLNKKGKV